MIEEAIRAYLLTLSAVTAITSTIRPNELIQSDIPPNSTDSAILLVVLKETFSNTLDGTCSLVAANVLVRAINRKLSTTRTLAEAIRVNGTNPGTGMAGANVTTGDLPFMAMLEEREVDVVRDQDGSDTGMWSTDSLFYLTFNETT